MSLANNAKEFASKLKIISRLLSRSYHGETFNQIPPPVSSSAKQISITSTQDDFYEHSPEAYHLCSVPKPSNTGADVEIGRYLTYLSSADGLDLANQKESNIAATPSQREAMYLK